MILASNETASVAFLLIDKTTYEPKAGLTPSVKISKGGPFTSPAAEVQEIGDGWYSVELSAEEVGDPGFLIFEASADGTHEWRDIHGVEDKLTAERVTELLAAELDAWAAQITVPIKFIRSGTSS